ncbi:MAG: hypothetical protein AMXMBFR64_26670 [Myxococcales bacterium]
MSNREPSEVHGITGALLHREPRDRHSTRNPLARALYQRYLQDVTEMVQRLDPRTVLEVGCGAGHFVEVLRKALPEARIVGVDLSERMVREAREHVPGVEFLVGSAYDLPYDDGSFDLVVAAEVLETLHDPQKALREIVRVTHRHALLSVARQPHWRALNMVRLAWLDEMGHHPGHVQDLNKGDFMRMVRGHFRVVEARDPLPWVIVSARKGG